MRPSMRLPLREAKYVCSSCRVGANPRISPLNQQFLRNASDSPGFLERTRRGLWGTDKPPGPKDPYSGSQIMPQEETAAESTDLSPGKAEEETSLPDEMDIHSLDWKNMPRVGYTKDKEWIVNGATYADRVKPWYKKKSPLSLDKALHQAVIEFSVMSMLGKTYGVLEGYEDRSQGILQNCSIEGESAEWGDRLRFSSKDTRDSVVTFFGQIAKPGTTKESLFSQLSDQGKLREDQFWEGGKIEARKESTVSSLPLNDPELKFAFFTRLSQLTGQRIPDAIYSSATATTVGEAIAAYKELIKQSIKMTPTRLHEQLAKIGTESLGNVKIYDSRRTRQDSDEDVGRKKVIVTSLYENGLISHPLGKRKEWIKMQKKQEKEAAKQAKLQMN
ncbi:hypothetical protein PENANT_c011G11145 [Penicillium antarcticum]|uniref:Large ribosomal subunit protein mL50 n=2 Tax=Penicillium antarcticum TaxID=416450 RepID=A0A1V6Q6L0_9EURO|nr:hypothetical protein PENANT_c011G11145 [Penicillium antarcticum]